MTRWASYLLAMALWSPSLAAADTQAIAAEMKTAIERERGPVGWEIRSLCEYRHPDSDGVRSACQTRQGALFLKMQDMWENASERNVRGAIAYCMNKSRAIHGFDWQDVSWCYERTIVTLRDQD